MMKRSESSLKLYRRMQELGYPEEFCLAVSGYLNTDFTAGRMLGYLKHVKKPAMEDVADELIAILEDREAIVQKKRAEETNAAYNRIMQEGLVSPDDEKE